MQKFRKIMYKLKIWISIFFVVVFVFLFFGGVNFAKADFTSCGITQTDPIWEIKATDGTRVLAVDSNGNLDITSTNKHLNTAPSGIYNDTFLIKNNGGTNRFAFNKTDAYISGSVTQGTNQSTLNAISGDDLVIKDSSNIIKARFDVATGNIYIAGQACGLAIQISTCEQLQNIKNDLSGDYVLTQDIDCSATATWNSDGVGGYYGFEPIGQSSPYFTGTFDGQGFEISNLYINRPSESSVALFGRTNNVVINDLFLENLFINGGSYTGGLVGLDYGNSNINIGLKGSNNIIGTNYVGGVLGYGYGSYSQINNSDIINTTVEGTGNYIGGLVGYGRKILINNSSFDGAISGFKYVGGLIGSHETTRYNNIDFNITSSYAKGNIISTGDYVGGLAGASVVSGSDFHNSISSSYSNIDISGVGYVGGLVGYINGGTTGGVDHSWSTGNVLATGNYVGGLIGQAKLDTNVITNSYSNNDISGVSYVGGLVGYNEGRGAHIRFSYATGSISASGSVVGGLIGYNKGMYGDGANLYNTYAVGKISGNQSGGLIGQNIDATVTDSYWNSETTGQLSSQGGGNPLTTNQMRSYNIPSNWTNYSGFIGSSWKLDTIYRNNNETYYACLSWQDDSTCAKAPIIISSCEDLQKIGNDSAYPLDGDYVLAQDIDCSATATWNSGAGFDPIGDSSNNFTGTFDGQNFEISDLYINRPSENYVGLFGYTGGAEIKNIGIIGDNIIGNYSVGGVAGYIKTNSIVSNCYNTGTVTGNSTVGGVVGYNYAGSSVSNCYNTGTVTDNGSIGNVGGVVGFNSGYSTVSYSYNTGTVNGNYIDVGGVVGYNYNNSSISNSYNIGMVNGYGNVGGITGNNNDDSNISFSYNIGTITGSDNIVGGVAGYNITSSSVLSSYNIGLVSGINYTGGLIGVNTNSTISNSYFNLDTSNQLQACYGTCAGAFSLTTDQMRSYQDPSNEGNFSSWTFDPATDANWKLDSIPQNAYETYYPCLSWQNNSTCTQAPLTISSCEDLQKIGNDSAYPLAGDYIVTQNIDCSATATWNPDGSGGYYGFDPIGDNSNPFTGNFDGQNFTISNLYINRVYESQVGLFGRVGTMNQVKDLIIKNLNLVNVNITGGDDTGGLIGEAYLIQMDNSSVNGNIYTNVIGNYIGGLIGSVENNTNNDSSVANSYFNGNISAFDDVGGLIGESSDNVISGSYAIINIDAFNKVGGLVGINGSNLGGSTIISSYSEGVINCKSYCGGLVAGNSGIIKGLIQDSYSTVSINATATRIGGLVGQNESNGEIKNSYATGDVFTSDSYIGGLVGQAGEGLIESSYASGDVSGYYAGGLVGYNIYGSTINNSYALGKVSASTGGGLIGGGGSVNISINNVYYNLDTSNQSQGCGGVTTCTGVTGLTTDQMRSYKSPTNQTNYNTWTFDAASSTAWKLDEITRVDRETYFPCLSWQDDSTCVHAPTIGSCQELQKIGNDPNYPLNGNYKVINNIDCSGIDFMPIGHVPSLGYDVNKFTGKFNGQNYIISNLTISQVDYSAGKAKMYVGLFAYASNADINNVKLVNVNISGVADVGALAGFIDYSDISNIYVNGKIYAYYNVPSGEAIGSVAGGLAGGTSNSTISDSYSTGSVQSDLYSGGLIGFISYYSTINDSYSNSNVSGQSYVGGLAGASTYSTINNSYATGAVSGTKQYIGGLIGNNLNNSTINNSYATGAVTGQTEVGGLIGINVFDINNSYSTGNVTGNTNVGGLIGQNYNNPSINSSYWDTSTSGQISACGSGDCSNVVGTSTTQMKKQSLYSGWDFSNIWTIIENATYPYFR